MIIVHERMHVDTSIRVLHNVRLLRLVRLGLGWTATYRAYRLERS